ncbi:ERCC4 domain protein [Necator americanus]|nr:ERCC4 domain protein [Necator americanus]ETN83944.1 ERCC4 domain protein [Necator americanus]
MQNICYVACDPCDQAEVLLIADAREDHGSMRGNTVVECLTSYSYRMEGRTLSVGDYLWVLRKVDGTEVVLDWVVERKTWQDLQQSIRMGRYEEQKQRLCRSPMKNRVYLVEGRFTPEYYACEQALATTMVTHGFMIQRTKSPEETAQFLCRITDHLKTMTATRQITGISYESLQELSKKANADTVKDMWIKQLMVCPGMSSHRAQQVAYRFPSMSSIIEQYSQAEDSLTDSLLSSTVPGVNRRLSVQMRKFFSVLHSTFPVEHHRLN